MSRVVIFGATSAIAQAFTRLLAQKGATFHLVARNEPDLTAIAADLRVRGAPQVTTRAADLADIDALGSLCDEAVDRLGGIDVALIAHGTLPDQVGLLASVPEALAAVRINALSPLAIALHLRSRMSAQGSGTIIILSSVAGDRGRPSNYLYGASKALLSVAGGGMAAEHKKTGIKILLIKPGFVDSPMTRQFRKGLLWSQPHQVAQRIAALLDAGKSGVYYVPGWWRWIMAIVRNVPNFVIARL